MTRLFDTVLIVDWSARGAPSPERPSADAIWIGSAGAGAEAPRYFRTRTAACAWLGDRLATARAGGARILVGFDFPFGYPRGFAEAVAGRPSAVAIWDLLAGRIEDGPDNANNRFAVAAELNGLFPGIGPFWGRPDTLDLPGLPARGTERNGHGLPERRLVEERVRRAQPTWKLYTTGSVGGQVLMGLPALARLRADSRLAGAIAVWPVETGLALPGAPLVLAEIYPSLLAAEPEAARAPDEVLDAAQVRVTAAAYAALDAAGGLAPLFSGAEDLTEDERRVVAGEEAWILGAGHEAELRAAVSVPPARNDCFALPPGVDWIPVDTALQRLREGLAPVAGVETVPLDAALGRITAGPVAARREHPPVANSAVDGYGYASGSLGPPPHDLPLIDGRAAAGRPFAAAVPPGSAVRVLTGAPLPDGVDTVVLDEDTARAGDRLHFARGPKPRANTRPRAEDVVAGAEILPAGALLRAQDLGLAASVGLGDLAVRHRLKVAVLSTGDEIRPAGAAAAAHEIFDANRPMLLAAVAAWGMAPVDLGHAPDDGAAVRGALDRGAASADAILASGGASAGDEDHLSRTLREAGTLTTWRIAVKPGRPLALGTWTDRPVFGLPGNPVAAFVCTLIFARPALFRLAGAAWSQPAGRLVPAAFGKLKKPGRREYLRARLDRDGRAEVFASEGSGRISGLSWADGLVELGDGAAEIRPGDPVRYLAFADFGL